MCFDGLLINNIHLAQWYGKYIKKKFVTNEPMNLFELSFVLEIQLFNITFTGHIV